MYWSNSSQAAPLEKKNEWRFGLGPFIRLKVWGCAGVKSWQREKTRTDQGRPQMTSGKALPGKPIERLRALCVYLLDNLFTVSTRLLQNSSPDFRQDHSRTQNLMQYFLPNGKSSLHFNRINNFLFAIATNPLHETAELLAVLCAVSVPFKMESERVPPPTRCRGFLHNTQQ